MTPDGAKLTILLFLKIMYFQGGLKAVVWTDVIQTIVMIAAMLIVVVKATFMVGGFEEVIKRNWSTGRFELPM